MNADQRQRRQRQPPDDHLHVQQPGDQRRVHADRHRQPDRRRLGRSGRDGHTGLHVHPAVPTGGTRIIGNGTNTGNTNTTGRFRNLNTNNNLGDTSNAGNVTIRYAGPITSFSFIYRNEVNTGEPQRIDMGDITFTC